MLPEIKIEFMLLGDETFFPEVVEKETGLPPDKIWKIGDAIGTTIRTHDNNAWVMSTGYVKTIDASPDLRGLLDRLMPLATQIRMLISRFDLHAEISFAMYVYDEVPVISFDATTVSEMASLNAALDVDIILVDKD